MPTDRICERIGTKMLNVFLELVDERKVQKARPSIVDVMHTTSTCTCVSIFKLYKTSQTLKEYIPSHQTLYKIHESVQAGIPLHPPQHPPQQTVSQN